MNIKYSILVLGLLLGGASLCDAASRPRYKQNCFHVFKAAVCAYLFATSTATVAPINSCHQLHQPETMSYGKVESCFGWNDHDGFNDAWKIQLTFETADDRKEFQERTLHDLVYTFSWNQLSIEEDTSTSLTFNAFHIAGRKPIDEVLKIIRQVPQRPRLESLNRIGIVR